MKSVNVFLRIQRAYDCRLIDMLGWRRLNKNAMNCRIAVQFLDACKQFTLHGRSGKFQFQRVQPEFAAHFVFGTHIGTRGWIISDENYAKTWRQAFSFQLRNIAAKISVNLFRNRAAVDQFRHGCVCHSERSLRMTKSQRISTSDIIASCTRRRSASNSSGVPVGLTRSGWLISTRTLENGWGIIKRSQLPSRQHPEYSR